MTLQQGYVGLGNTKAHGHIALALTYCKSMVYFYTNINMSMVSGSILHIIPRNSRHSAKAQENARRHDEGYALITAQNAASAAERGRTWGRG